MNGTNAANDESQKASADAENLFVPMFVPESSDVDCEHMMPIERFEDPDLSRVFDAWPNLPAAIKAGIMAMIDATR
jgi:hypothetical protein